MEIEDFEKAVNVVNSKSFSADNEEKLMLYALYKIVTVGQKPTKARNNANPIESAKWDAWNDFGSHYARETAITLYPSLVNKLENRK